MNYDVIVVGGGPAGLNGALVLGRCRRSVLLCDAGKPRNCYSHGVHNFFTRDCTDPKELVRIGREQLKPYGVEIRDTEVRAACLHEGGFKVTLVTDEVLYCRKLLLATGVHDDLPEIENVRDFYGKSVHHCPYCDGWEWKEQPLAVYGKAQHGYFLALSLLTWTNDLVLVTDGPSRLNPEHRKNLEKLRIPIRTERIARLHGTDGMLEKIEFRGGEILERRAMFFSTGQKQRCDLPKSFGCVFTQRGAVRTGRHEETNIPGLYVAGDASHDVQFVIVAASEGAKAGMAINAELQKAELERLLA